MGCVFWTAIGGKMKINNAVVVLQTSAGSMERPATAVYF